jgi:hypothetical protein
MKIYLDACCLNRPFDDQSQERIRLEAEAVAIILVRITWKQWEWPGSQALEIEISRAPDVDQQSRMKRVGSFINSCYAVPRDLSRPARQHECCGTSELRNISY